MIKEFPKYLMVLVLFTISLISIKSILLVKGVNREANRYYPELPEHLHDEALKPGFLKDGDFKILVEDHELSRKVNILIKSTSQGARWSTFRVKLFSNKGADFTQKKLIYEVKSTHDGVPYFYNENNWFVYSVALPFINADQLEVERLGKNKMVTLLNPFTKHTTNLQLDSENQDLDDYSVNQYWPILKLVSSYFEIKTHEVIYKTKKGQLVAEKDGIYHSENAKWDFIASKGANEAWSFFGRPISGISVDDAFEFSGPNADSLRSIFGKFEKSELELHQFMDVQKLGVLISLNQMFYGGCRLNFDLVLNSETRLLEPIVNYPSCETVVLRKFNKIILNNDQFNNILPKVIEAIGNMPLEELIENQPDELRQELFLINGYYPKKICQTDLLKINQEVLIKSISPSRAVEVVLVSYDERELVLEIKNVCKYPVELKGIQFDGNSKIIKIEDQDNFQPGRIDTLSLHLPRSFENLFVDKKNKTTGFQVLQHLPLLTIEFNILNVEGQNFAPILPYSGMEDGYDLGIMELESNVRFRDDMYMNEESKVIGFQDSVINIKAPIVVPKGYTLEIKPGTHLHMIGNGKIISFSKLRFIGQKDAPIIISSPDDEGMGLIVLSANETSELRYVEFKNLSNPLDGHWSVSGAVTFYESPVNLDYVSIENNHSEDAINIIRTHFTMRNCSFVKTQSDAFDGDFVEGSVTDSDFMEIGNDAIDVSGSSLIINNVTITKAGDKGLSAGENSQMNVKDIEIVECAIGIASKDLSTVLAENVLINSTKLGFTAFQKKPEFGASIIDVKKLTLQDIELEYLIEERSSLKIDGQEVETATDVKGRMYGVEFGVDSKDTRNKKKQ